MSHFCWVCERVRPNESFSGRNHARHVCRECARIPRSERDQKERLSALWEMLCSQSNISPANRGMAAAWAAEGNDELQSLAQLVLDIGRVHPRKKKRLPFIRRNHPDLWRRMIAMGVAEDGSREWHDPDDPCDRPESVPDDERSPETNSPANRSTKTTF